MFVKGRSQHLAGWVNAHLREVPVPLCDIPTDWFVVRALWKVEASDTEYFLEITTGIILYK